MLEDEKLAIDESERAARHQAIKGEVRREMQDKIAREAKRTDADQHAEAAVIGEHLREKAIGEIAGTESEIERGRAAARVSQVIDYIFYLIYALVALEIVLELLGARETNSFKRFMDALTAPLLLPFNTLMPDLAQGRFQLKISYLVALLVYVLLHFAINGLLRLLAHRKTVV
jgi:uncharacterized protein YggT (Ycf19 family)